MVNLSLKASSSFWKRGGQLSFSLQDWLEVLIPWEFNLPLMMFCLAEEFHTFVTQVRSLNVSSAALLSSPGLIFLLSLVLAGNVKFRNLVESHFEAYNEATKNQKAVIIEGICNHLSEKSVRFLKYCAQNEEWQEETDRSVIKTKIQCSFRSLRAALKRKTQDHQAGAMQF